MKPIKENGRVSECGRLVGEMMLAEMGREYEFKRDWLIRKAWLVVPVESASRLRPVDIPVMVGALRQAGQKHCFAVFNEPGYIQQLPVIVHSEPPSEVATCYSLSIDEADFHAFNRELGLFRSVLTTQARSWAISCNEWYNLFAAEADLLEALLGKPLDQARQEFFEFASCLARGNAEEPILKMAQYYAALSKSTM